MHWVLYIVLAVLALLLVLLLSPAWIRISFSYIGGKTTVSFFAGLGPIRVNLTKLLQRRDRPEKPKVPEENKKKLSFADIETGIKKAIDAARYLRKKFTVSLFSLKVRLATGDAADTGIVTGAAYASVYSLLGLIDRHFVLKKHEVVITPVFQGVGLEAEICGKFQLRLIRCLGLINKVRKGDVK